MHNLKLSAAVRTRNIKYAIRDIILLADKARAQGKEMFYLNIGDPLKFDFCTPDHIIEAIYRALKDGHNGYAPSAGVAEALDAIRRDAERRGIKNIVDIFVSTGVSEAIEIAVSGLVNPGENVLTPLPGYPLYTSVLSKMEAEMNEYLLDEENGWQPDVEDIARKINDRSRGIVIVNPNNPTGAVFGKGVLEQIIELARKYNLVIFSDEIYDKLILNDKEHISIASLAPDVSVVTLNGLSKSYLVPGLRVGWAVVSGEKELLKEYTEAMKKMTRARLCASHPCQYAIAPALDGDQNHVLEMNEKLRQRRDLTFEMLNDIPGVKLQKPDGAFYAFANITDIEGTDEDFVRDLIMQTGVITVHGSGFGQKPGSKHFRVVFLAPEEILKKAYGLIHDFVLHG